MEGLEPYDGKLSSTILRGESGRKACDLPGAINNMKWKQENEDVIQIWISIHTEQ